MNIIILFFALFINCNNVQENKKADPIVNHKKDTLAKKVSPIEINNFVADTTINNQLLLENYQSFERLKLDKLELIERIRSTPVIVFSNVNNQQYLIAYQYEGNTKNSFSCFEIGNLSDLKNVNDDKINFTNFHEFKTESKLQLGQSIDEVRKIKGYNYQEKIEKGEITLSYKIDDIKKSNFLKRYNMPSYFLNVSFSTTKKIKRILFGFEYP